MKIVEQQKTDLERLKVDLHSSNEQTRSMQLEVNGLSHQLKAEQQKNTELSAHVTSLEDQLQDTKTNLDMKSAVNRHRSF